MDGTYASFGRRALASTIDNLTWLIGGAILLAYLPSSIWDDHPEVAGILILVLISAWFNYFAVSEWRWGQTIGKNATGIEVRSCEGARQRDPSQVGGDRLTYGQASIRNLLRIIDFFVIGEVMIVATDRHQRLGDKAAKTVVLRREPRAARLAPVRGAADPPPAAPPPAPPPAVPPPAPPPGAAAPGPDRGFPLVPWTIRNTIWGLVIGLLTALFVPLLVLPFDSNLGDSDKASDAALLAAQGLFDGALVMVAIGVASGWRFRPLKDALVRLGIRAFELSAFGWMFLMLLLYYVGAAIFSLLVVQPDQEDIGKELGVCNPGVGIAIAAVLLIVVLAPLTEELFFRGFFFGGLRGRWGLWPSALVSGALFGLVHAPTGPTAAIPLAGLGVGLAWLYEKTGSIWPSITAHFLNNAIAIVAVIATC